MRTRLSYRDRLELAYGYCFLTINEMRFRIAAVNTSCASRFATA
jgi:hypothetical protein